MAYLLEQAFKRLYEEVGLGWVYAVTNFEPVSVPPPLIFSELFFHKLMDSSVHRTCVGAENGMWIPIYYHRLANLPIQCILSGRSIGCH